MSRRAFAASGDRRAISGRSEIDRSGGLGKPRQGAAIRETTSRPSPRPPPEDDTLALVPRDLRGASAGVAPNRSWVATWLPHHAPVGVSAAERFRCDPETCGVFPAVRTEASGVSPPLRGGRRYDRAIPGRIACSHSSRVRLSGCRPVRRSAGITIPASLWFLA